MNTEYAQAKKASEELQEKRAGALAILAKSPEFDILKTVIKDQIQLRRMKLEEPILSEKDVAEHNRLIGEISGMSTVICYPDVILKKLDLSKEIDQEMEKQNGRSN